MREADFDCPRYDACYEPPPLTGAEWGWPEWALVFAIVFLVVWLLWLIARAPAKPEKPLKERVVGHLGSAETEASNWEDQKAARLLQRTREKILEEFGKG